MAVENVVEFGHGGMIARLSGNRLHLVQGPINVVIKAYGPTAAVELAYSKASATFSGLLEQLVADLGTLRTPVSDIPTKNSNVTSYLMQSAVSHYSDQFVTPMAAVAGAVADTLLAAMCKAPGLDRAYVNNGGDIALYLAPGRSLDVGVVPHLQTAIPEAKVSINESDDIGGIATSGWDGHSQSFGVADAVTVLAHSAAAADVAATLIGNATATEHPTIIKRPARQVRADSDLGDRLVTISVGKLLQTQINHALNNGARFAEMLCHRGLINAALLAVQGSWQMVGDFAQQMKGTPIDL